MDARSRDRISFALKILSTRHNLDIAAAVVRSELKRLAKVKSA
jgi:hypothetical protein